MSRLTVYADHAPEPVLDTDDGAVIQRTLAGAGVVFERWEAGVALPPGAGQDEVLAAYADEITRLKASGGYVAVDVVRLAPDHPQREAIRAKFLAEHTHRDDEVRFFVEGVGLFCLHIGGRVYAIRAEAGDLVSVPAGTPHWFDTGAAPRFAAIRLFIDPAGWEAHYTGSDIAARFPTLDV